MRIIKLILLLVFVISFLNAQEQNNPWDIILKKNNTTIQCKILKVTTYNIEYRPKTGKPFLIIPRGDVISIIYSDETVVPPNNQKKEYHTQWTVDRVNNQNKGNDTQEAADRVNNQNKGNDTHDINLRNIPQEREEICRNCNGSGSERVTCSVCNGSGRLKCGNCTNGTVLTWVIEWKQRAHFENVVCPNCNGTTQISCYGCNGTGMTSRTCRACDGKGKVLLNK